MGAREQLGVLVQPIAAGGNSTLKLTPTAWLLACATTALHRKRAYAKLGVRSQAQLFHHFIQSLAGVPREADGDSVATARVRELPRRQPSEPSALAGLS